MTRSTLHRTLGPVVALAAAVSVGSDWGISLWSARMPWIPAAYQDVWLTASGLGMLVMVVYSRLVARKSPTRPTGSRSPLTIYAGGALLVLLLASTFGATAPLLGIATVVNVGLGLAASVAVSRDALLARWSLIGFGCLILLELPLCILQETTQSRFQPGAFFRPAQAADAANLPGAAVLFGPDGLRWQRALGSFPHPNVLGGFVAIALVLALPYLQSLKGNRLALLRAGWCAGWVELVFTFSRAALLAAAVGCGIWLIGGLVYAPRRSSLGWLALAPIVALALGGAVAGPYFFPRIAPTSTLLRTTPIVDRLTIGLVALSLIQTHPLLGVGAGNFTLAELRPPFDAVSVDPVHNVPLLVAAEAGLPAGVAWLVIVVGQPIANWKRRRHDRASWVWFALPAAMLTLSFLDHYLWTLPAGRLIFWLGLGIWAAIDAETHPNGSGARSTMDPRVGVG